MRIKKKSVMHEKRAHKSFHFENREEDECKSKTGGKAETSGAGGPFPCLWVYLITQVGVSSVDQ